MRSKGSAQKLAMQDQGEVASGSSLRQVRQDLERSGVASNLASELARKIADRVSVLEPEAYESLLEGVRLGACARPTEPDDRESELREIERLMGDFAGELSKLDEVLEVLAAYVRRMRTSSPRTVERTLH